ncbi:MAG: diacylglycerol/lipid kinase family protein [Chloroflexota bacterium]
MKVVIIHNPRAGRSSGEEKLKPALQVLHDADWSVTVRTTAAPGHATHLAREAAGLGMDAVLVSGGDGTVNEVVQGLVNTDTAFGYLPSGTVNVWARELNIPRDPGAAARALLTGRIERIDLGMVGERYFLLMAGVGFDGHVLRRARVLERHKPRFGVLPYVAIGLSSAPTYRGADIELRYDGMIRKVQALMLVLGNTRLYGGRFHITPKAVMNDGWLDLSIIKGRGPLALARQSLPLFLSGTVSQSDVELIRVRTLHVSSEERLPLQVDGEFAGTTPATFQVAPRALSAIIPEGFASNLIA